MFQSVKEKFKQATTNVKKLLGITPDNDKPEEVVDTTMSSQARKFHSMLVSSYRVGEVALFRPTH